MAQNPSIVSASMVAPTFEPVAVTLDKAVELLGRPIEEIQAAAAQVVPYRHHDGTPRWSLRELRIALGEPMRGRRRRSKNGIW